MKQSLLDGMKIIIAVMLVVVALGLTYLITPFFGNKVLIVRSGSMTPTLPVGSLVAIRPKDLISSPLPAVPLYSTGDVLSYKDSRNPKVVTTHRVLSYKIEDNQIFYQVKGDANSEPDQTLVAEKNVLGTTFLTLPYLGILFSFTKTKIGFLLLVLIPALMVILLESWNIFKEIRKKKHYRYNYLKGFHLNEGPALTALIPLLAVGLVFAQTSAYFSDTAVSSGNVFASAQSFGTSHVVISEVQIDGGTGQANSNDFIELYNPTSSPFNLNGHRLVLRTGNSSNDTNIFGFNSTHIIPAHGYFLWGHLSDNNNFATSIGADVSSADVLGASNSVALRNGALDTGTPIDALSWNSGSNSLVEGANFSPNPGINESMERKAYSTSTAATMNGGADAAKGNGYDTNNNSTDFVLRTTSQPQNSFSITESP